MFYLTLAMTLLLHNLFFMYVIYMFFSRSITADKVAAVKNLLWLVPVYAVFVFLNQIKGGPFFGEYSGYNFFFTSRYENPLLFVWNWFEGTIITANFWGRAWEFNFIYLALVISLASALLYFAGWLFEWGAKKVDQRQTNEIRKDETKTAKELLNVITKESRENDEMSKKTE